MSHTPGPWKLCFHLQSAENDSSCPCGYGGGIWSGDGEQIICSIGERLNELYPEPIARPISLANARLIAAAPELLAVLKEAELDCRGFALHGWLEMATAVIAEAEGTA